MHGVVRFLDTPLLPASSPEDYPKVIKSGIDEEGQHHKSPSITGPSGIATLLHKIGRPELLDRLFDIEGTEEYDFRVFMDMKLYMFSIGFINSKGEWAQHGVRYRIVPEPAGSLYRVRKWEPICTLGNTEKIAAEDYEKRRAAFEPGNEGESKMGMLGYYKGRIACRADCGEKEPKLCCSKCKIARYCSASCQSEDWKYHKTIPEEYMRLLR